MFYVVGIEPILYSLLVGLLLIFTSTMIGGLFTLNKQFNALTFFCGFIYIISCFAVFNTGLSSFFTPLVLVVPIFIGIKIQFNKDFLKQQFKIFLRFGTVFLIMLIIDLVRYRFFLNDIIISNYPDFPFYGMVAENLIKYKVESPFNYLLNFDLEATPSFYHYFDIYFLGLMNRLNMPSFFAYTYTYFPFIKTIGLVLLVDIINSLYPKRNNKSLIFIYFTAFCAIFSISFGIDNGIFIEKTSYYLPKTIYSIIGFYFVYLWMVSRNVKYLIFIQVVSFYLNPLVFIIVFCCSIILIVLDFSLFRNTWGLSNNIRNYFTKKYIFSTLGTVLFLFLVVFINDNNFGIATKNDNASIGISLDANYLKLMFERIFGYLSVIKYRPYFVLLLIVFGIVLKVKDRRKSQFFKLIFSLLIFALVGHVLSGVAVFHTEGFQFHQLGFEAAFFISTGIVLSLIIAKETIFKIIGFISFITLFTGYFIFGLSIFNLPAESYSSSKSYFNEIYNNIEADFQILYIEEHNKYWRRNLPHMVFDVGLYKTKRNVTITKPLTSSMFNNTAYKQFPEIWGFTLSKSPFQIYCDQNEFFPINYMDETYFNAIYSFIKRYKIDAIIINKNLNNPIWLKRLPVSKIIVGSSNLDKHEFYLLNQSFIK